MRVVLPSLPQPLLSRVWPWTHIEMGLQTCRLLRQELAPCAVHLSAVVCGPANSGKSTLAGRLLVELDCVKDAHFRSVQAAAEQYERETCAAFAFLFDETRESRGRGLTLTSTSKKCCTPCFRYTLFDTPGCQDFIGGVVAAVRQAEVGILTVPADQSFEQAMQKARNHGTQEGSIRQHVRLLAALGVRKLIVCVTKMDVHPAMYDEGRFREVVNELQAFLSSFGWNADTVPFIPVTGRNGDNVTRHSELMPWWSGAQVFAVADGTLAKVRIFTLVDALDHVGRPLLRSDESPLRFSVRSSEGRHDGVLIRGRVEQGLLRVDDQVAVLPGSGDGPDRATGTVVSIERYRSQLVALRAGESAAVVVCGLGVVPRDQSVLAHAEDTSLSSTMCFVAKVSAVAEVCAGCRLTASLRYAEVQCRVTAVDWVLRRRERVENVDVVRAGEVAQVRVEVSEPVITCARDEGCEWLRRVVLWRRGVDVVLHSDEVEDDDGNDGAGEVGDNPPIGVVMTGRLVH